MESSDVFLRQLCQLVDRCGEGGCTEIKVIVFFRVYVLHSTYFKWTCNEKHFQILSDWTVLVFFAKGLAFLCMVPKHSAKQDGKIMTLLFSLLVKQWVTVFSGTKHNKICVSKFFLLCVIWKLKSRHLLQSKRLYLVGCLVILKCFQKCKIKSSPPLKKIPEPSSSSEMLLSISHIHWIYTMLVP